MNETCVQIARDDTFKKILDIILKCLFTICSCVSMIHVPFEANSLERTLHFFFILPSTGVQYLYLYRLPNYHVPLFNVQYFNLGGTLDVTPFQFSWFWCWVFFLYVFTQVTESSQAISNSIDKRLKMKCVLQKKSILLDYYL